MIGDKEQNYPGVAPRAFKAIYELIDENKYVLLCDLVKTGLSMSNPHCRKILQANLQTQAWKFASSCHVFVVAASETEDFSIFYVSWIF